MPELQRLEVGHAAALLEFELTNRAYFARTIGDRGDEFFEHFAEKLDDRLAEQQRGEGVYHVLVAEDGAVLGRFNLIIGADHTAELGFRMAEHATGQGLATTAVREVCGLARVRYDVQRIRAASALENTASQRVLAKSGFRPVGPADPAAVGGQPGMWYERELVVP